MRFTFRFSTAASVLVATAFVLLYVTPARAQQADNPVAVRVNYWGTAVRTGAAAPASFTFGSQIGSAATATVWGQPGGTTFSSTDGSADVVPGKDYVVQVTGANVGYVQVYFVENHGYRIYLDGTRTTTLCKGVTYTFHFRLEKTGDVSESLAGSRAGSCTSIVSDKPIWYLGLGSMRNGNYAGGIGFRKTDFSVSDIYTPSGLVYESPDTSEVDVVLVSSTLRQVYAREALVDIEAVTTDSYTMKVYARSDLITWDSGLGLYDLSSVSPYVTYTVAKRTVSGGDGIAITRAEHESTGDVTWQTSLEKVGEVWTHRDWRLTTASDDDKVTTDYSTTPATVTHQGHGASGSIESPLVWQKTLTTQTWGKELTDTTFGPNETVKVETQYSYYTTTASDGSVARLLKWVKKPDGSWRKNLYYNTSDSNGARGQLKRAYTPWLDACSDPDSATAANSVYEDWTYSIGVDGTRTLPHTRLVYAPDASGTATLIARTEWAHNLSAVTLNGHALVCTVETRYSDDSSTVATTRYYHRSDDSLKSIRDEPASIQRPDGSKEAFAYFDGSWDATTRTFTASSSGDDRLVLAFHGQSVAGSASPVGASVGSWTNNSITWSFPSLYMRAGRSTVSEVVVDTMGRVVFSAENIYTSSGTLERVSGTEYRFDSHGRQIAEVDVVRSVGSTELKTSRTYSASLMTTATAADGVVTFYEYDNLLRNNRTTAGYGGTGAYPAVTTEMKFDGAGRPVETHTGDTSGTPVSVEYDGAGRIDKRKEPKPDSSGDTLDTTFSYDTVCKVTTTLPTGATATNETYLDGRPKSTTGTAQPAVFYAYETNSTGLKVTRKNGSLVSGTWTETLANGWAEEQYDRLGRTVTTTMPTYGWTSGTAHTMTTTNSYNSSGQLWNVGVSCYDGSTTSYPVADKLYEYGNAGELLREGSDINDDGDLDLASNDRIVAYDGWCDTDSWGWRQVSTTSTYATSGSSTATEASYVVSRLTGFNNGSVGANGLVVGDMVTLDANDRWSVRWDYIDAAQKQRRSDMQVQGDSTWAYECTKNGYLAAANSLTGVLSKWEYDTYGRLQYACGRGRVSGSSTVYDSTTAYAYYGRTGVASSVTVDGIPVSYEYTWDATTHTRTITAFDAAGAASYTRCDVMGRPIYVWGSAVQPVAYTYDDFGRDRAMTTWRTGTFTGTDWPSSPGTGATTSWDVEEATGLMLEKTCADSTTEDPRKWTYTYTSLGQVATRQWARDNGGSARLTTTYAYYDGSTTATSDVSHRTGELRAVTYNDGGVTPGTSYTYMRTGAPYQVTDVTGTRTFAYRSDLQLASETLPSAFFGTSRTITPTYEDGTNSTVPGRVSGYQLLLGSTEENATSFSFDAATGRVSQVVGKTGTSGFTYGYAVGTDWVETVTSNTSGGYARTNTLMDSRAALEEIETKWGSTTKALYTSNVSGGFDARGLRAKVVQSGTLPTAGTTTFSYNVRGELEGSSFSVGTTKNFTWGYDLMGKRTTATASVGTTTYTASAQAAEDVNEYVSITGVNAESGLAYDEDGNMTEDGTWYYRYDAENRLVEMEKKDSSQTLQFIYDYMGRRVRKTVRNGTPSATIASCTKFVWSGWRLSAELDGGTNQTGTSLAKTYVWGSDISGGTGAGGLLSVTQSSVTYYPVYDLQGNVTGYLSSSDGSTAAGYEYNPYGELLAQSGSSSSFAFGFATQYTDRESGLVYYGLRYYNSRHGRFINRDPIGEQGGLNLYNFVRNSPTNGWDRLGTTPNFHDPYDLIRTAPSDIRRTIRNAIGYGIGWSCRSDGAGVSYVGMMLADMQDAAMADLTSVFRTWAVMSLRRAMNALAVAFEAGEYQVTRDLESGGFRVEPSSEEAAATLANVALLYEAVTGKLALIGSAKSPLGIAHYDSESGVWVTADGRVRTSRVTFGEIFVLSDEEVALEMIGAANSTGGATGTVGSGSGPQTILQLGYTEAYGRHHTFVIATDPVTGEQYITRASASHRTSPASTRASGSSASGGSSSASSGSGSSGGYGFGTIKAEHGRWNEQLAFDQPSVTVLVQYVGVVNLSYQEVQQRMIEFGNVTNQNAIPYWPFGPNSNSYAFTFVESMGFARPKPEMSNVPGWELGRPDPALSYFP